MIFKIKKNTHYSNNWGYKLINLFNFKSDIIYDVRFTKSCLYSFNDEDKDDVNKLFGFSILYHHHNSYRFGWNSNEDSINIYSYCYVNGERIINFITKIQIDKDYKFIINKINDRIYFKVLDVDNYKISYSSEKISKNIRFGYKLWPYFGGNKKSPNDMEIILI